MLPIHQNCVLIGVIVLSTTLLRAASPLQIWFAPLDPTSQPNRRLVGSPQYTDLFHPESPWKSAAANLSVFKIYSSWIAQASDMDLREQFADLKRRNIQLALEIGPLTPSTNCALGIVGEGSLPLPIANALKRVVDNGGTLAYLAMDEPMYFSYARCHWDAAHAAENIAANLKAITAKFPDLKIGDIEPLSGAAYDGLSIEEITEGYRRFIKAFEMHSGFPLAFFHLDINWNSPCYPDNLVSVRNMVRSLGVPLGVIYNGNGGEDSDLEWVANTKRHMESSESVIGRPDQAVFQSWHSHPSKLIPDSDQDSFTWLINQYLRERTYLVGRIARGLLSGSILGTKMPVSGAQVNVFSSPEKSVENPTFVSSVTNSIPAKATRVVVALRVNSECGCSGDTDFQVDRFELQTDRLGQRIWSFDTPIQLSQWESIGKSGQLFQLPGGAQCTVSNGHLLVLATKSQRLSLNSRPISGFGLGTFTFKANGRASPKAIGRSYFSLIFLDDHQEISRFVLPNTSQSGNLLGTAITNLNGEWGFDLKKNKIEPEIRVRYPGDLNRWPSDLQLQP